ncbi:MAG TPA: DNA/RNA non-specific endonuclease [Kiritimatiellia bacterium]|jgi:endonuclease G|nr:DNA/RNA non-specific endonuclease [Kiritimatiellia bacterium]HOR96788.1 DNA/RNA non-specific endonuclease [Kiritimatiellia bacterium]HPC49060.1 DNA/RNA non-specific endonuclease [Kiritimatiellia bacterium]HPK36786.1 DNA/RNA non-specific endonuclease [Kiritimatiellia bacterium]HPW74359.1 DNA/RNA non-specific endonuclease [Kiritimatiellia bacterium]
MTRRLLRFARSFVILVSLFLLSTLIAANALVHLPRQRQQSLLQNLPDVAAQTLTRVGHAAADITDGLGWTGRDAVAALPQPTDTNRLTRAGVPRRLPSCTAPDDLVVLNKIGFTIGYSPAWRHPVWVAYRADPTCRNPLLPRPSGFKPDPAAPRSPKHREYSRSGYNRGHMVPNRVIASRHGPAAQAQTFLTSNICPQRASLNQGPWENLEFRIAELWPTRYGSVWVLAGAVPAPEARRLPSGIHVPAAFYQIVVTQPQDGTLRAFAVYMPQHVRRRTPVRSMLVSIDELETLTGFDFLSELPDEVEAELEAATPTRLWPVGLVGTIRLVRERFRRYPVKRVQGAR